MRSVKHAAGVRRAASKHAYAYRQQLALAWYTCSAESSGNAGLRRQGNRARRLRMHGSHGPAPFPCRSSRFFTSKRNNFFFQRRAIETRLGALAGRLGWDPAHARPRELLVNPPAAGTYGAAGPTPASRCRSTNRSGIRAPPRVRPAAAPGGWARRRAGAVATPPSRLIRMRQWGGAMPEAGSAGTGHGRAAGFSLAGSPPSTTPEARASRSCGCGSAWHHHLRAVALARNVTCGALRQKKVDDGMGRIAHGFTCDLVGAGDQGCRDRVPPPAGPYPSSDPYP
jgi:hypothetical protein